ncbi:hypothetical protein MG293_017590 [Ovis ammon polii]|uniref:Uncharacterized protein n=1 Tax=Ovis ammon polii TaxID=230172 RepID=A0AAD4TVA8_OVIAM|nr:hypothetical protein MG293_017590 [Ovis ammon polii]
MDSLGMDLGIKKTFEYFHDIGFSTQEALLAAISEKDANIALLELSASKKKKTQEEVMALKREKDRLVHQLKQQGTSSCEDCINGVLLSLAVLEDRRSGVIVMLPPVWDMEIRIHQLVYQFVHHYKSTSQSVTVIDRLGSLSQLIAKATHNCRLDFMFGKQGFVESHCPPREGSSHSSPSPGPVTSQRPDSRPLDSPLALSVRCRMGFCD